MSPPLTSAMAPFSSAAHTRSEDRAAPQLRRLTKEQTANGGTVIYGVSLPQRAVGLRQIRPNADGTYTRTTFTQVTGYGRVFGNYDLSNIREFDTPGFGVGAGQCFSDAAFQIGVVLAGSLAGSTCAIDPRVPLSGVNVVAQSADNRLLALTPQSNLVDEFNSAFNAFEDPVKYSSFGIYPSTGQFLAGGRQNLQFASLGHEQGQIVSDTAFIEFLLFFYGKLNQGSVIADTPGTITFGKTIQDQSVFDTVLSITSPVSDVSP